MENWFFQFFPSSDVKIFQLKGSIFWAPSWRHLMGKTGKTSFPWSVYIGPKPGNSKPSISITLHTTFYLQLKSKLSEHIKAHSDARTFLCVFCGKALKNRQCLNRLDKLKYILKKIKLCFKMEHSRSSWGLPNQWSYTLTECHYMLQWKFVSYIKLISWQNVLNFPVKQPPF